MRVEKMREIGHGKSVNGVHERKVNRKMNLITLDCIQCMKEREGGEYKCNNEREIVVKINRSSERWRNRHVL